MGTNAVTQALGHILKLIYYGSLIVERITDNHFKRIGRYAVMVIGIVYLAKGIAELI